jgi:hypothetical protein
VSGSLSLASVASLIASIGRGVVFRSPRWNPNEGPLNTLAQLGVTEGDISIATQPQVAGLTIPELTGPIPHEIDYQGENPKIEVPLYLTDPNNLAICSPSGSQHAGRSRRGPVAEHTIMIVPEALFLENIGSGIISDTNPLAFDDSGIWTINGQPMTDEQVELFGMSFWLWRAFFDRPPRRFRGGAGDASKNIEQVSIMSMHAAYMPEGHHIYTTGDPFENGIDLNGMS